MNRASLEYLRVEVTADVTLDAQTVAIAVVPRSQQPSTWAAATWLGTAGMTRTARLAPGWSTSLAPGTYAVFVKVTDNPEIPVLSAGQIQLN